MAASEIPLTSVRRTLFGDIRDFLWHRPDVPTFVDQSQPERREHLSQSILQRLGIDVTTYSVLNVHRIGIDVPCRFVFSQLMDWGGEALYWPDRIAKAQRVDGRIEHIEIYLFGWRRILCFKATPLFCMKAVEIHSTPLAGDMDNARFLLFTCEGGYPIGHFTLYLRSPIDAIGEAEPSQLFLAVGFNVYGHRHLSQRRWAMPISRAWQAIHNRVTGNVLNRLKVMCEKEFKRIESGASLISEPQDGI